MKVDKPDNRVITNMLAMEMYLDSVFDARPDLTRPPGDRRAYAVACHLAGRGDVLTYPEWCAVAGVEMDGTDYAREPNQTPEELEKRCREFAEKVGADGSKSEL